MRQCGYHGACKRESCEKWDQYAKTCSQLSKVLILREIVSELRYQRRYMRPRTVGELQDDIQGAEDYPAERVLRGARGRDDQVEIREVDDDEQEKGQQAPHAREAELGAERGRSYGSQEGAAGTQRSQEADARTGGIKIANVIRLRLDHIELKDIKDMLEKFHCHTGIQPNRLIMGSQAYEQLRDDISKSYGMKHPYPGMTIDEVLGMKVSRDSIAPENMAMVTDDDQGN